MGKLKCPELAASLADAGLVDEYCLYIHPVVLGSGKALFAGPRPPLRLVGSERIGGDVNSARRELANRFRDVGDSGRVKRVRGSGLPGESEFLVRNIDAYDVCAERARNHHR